MRLQIRRLGGIAGVTLRTQLDTAELPAEHAARVESAVRGLAGGAPAPPPHPDAFRYEIAQLDDPSQAPVVLNEHEVPPELDVLIDALAGAGEIERRDPGGAA